MSPSQATGLSIRNLVFDIGDRRIIDDLSLDIDAGEAVCLLGPSGSGKTTSLRLVAGLERPLSGEILMGDEVLAGANAFVPAEKRQIGLLHQEFALFPHLSVAGNVGFGLKKWARTKREARVMNLLEEVGLDHRSGDFPHQLSGGEQQRVALMRALAVEPRLMLLDEPFSSLDVMTRLTVRDLTMGLLKDKAVPTLLVTHDPEEALAIADRIGIMRAGRLVQLGAPDELYLSPANSFVMDIFGRLNRIPAVVSGARAPTPFGYVDVSRSGDGEAVEICFRASALRLASDGEGIPARVHQSRAIGPLRHLELIVDGIDEPLIMEEDRDMAAKPGENIMVSADLGAFHAFEIEAGEH